LHWLALPTKAMDYEVRKLLDLIRLPMSSKDEKGAEFPLAQLPLSRQTQAMLWTPANAVIEKVAPVRIPRNNISGLPNSTSSFMHPQYTALFTAIDEFVRTRHRCFVAELDFSQTKWAICIRPTQENIPALARDVYACKYFHPLARRGGRSMRSKRLRAKAGRKN
jgi:hypothetical protein